MYYIPIEKTDFIKTKYRSEIKRLRQKMKEEEDPQKARIQGMIKVYLIALKDLKNLERQKVHLIEPRQRTPFDI